MLGRCVRTRAITVLVVLVLAAACSSKESGGSKAEPSAATSGTSKGAALSASDVGVTADTITVAYAYPDLADLVKRGLVDDLVPTAAHIQPLVDAVNADGGINGRTLALRDIKWDPLKVPASLVANCTEIAEDQPTFATFSSAFFGDGAGCLAGDHDVPLLTMSGMAGTIFEEIKDNAFLFNMTFEEAQRSAVTALDDKGVLKGLKLGVLIRDEPGGQEAVDAGLRPALEKLGYKLAEVAVIAGTGDPASQSAAVQRFKDAGVDGVFLAANTSVSGAFLAEADRQGYRPHFFGSDQSEVTTDAIAKNVPKGELDGAMGVTFRRTASEAVGHATAQEAACVKERNTVQPKLAEPGSVAYNGFTQVCAMFHTMVEAMRDAGPDLTRAGFIRAMESLGSFELGTGGKGSFAADRHVAPSEVRLVTFHDSCSCWKASGPYVPFS
jgi:ABC-type branched-subunit amino acid transport system substrate-binding protein